MYDNFQVLLFALKTTNNWCVQRKLQRVVYLKSTFNFFFYCNTHYFRNKQISRKALYHVYFILYDKQLKRYILITKHFLNEFLKNVDI